MVVWLRAKMEAGVAVNRLRALVVQQTDLNVRTDDNFMLRLLGAADGDPDKAFSKMLNFYQLKRDHPDWYASEPPSAFKDCLEMGCDYVLQDRDPSGKRVWICKPSKVDATRTTMAQLSQMHDLLLETILDEPETQENGMAVIVDLKDLPWALLRWFTPANVKISTKKADALPFPRMEYHIVNNSVVFNILLKIIYPFLSAKQKENLIIHGDNWDSLHTYVSATILPEEFGGCKPNSTGDKLHSQIYNYTDKLMVNLKMGYQAVSEQQEQVVT